jgi:hypothetical protein
VGRGQSFVPGTYEMDVKGTVFETQYQERFIDHYKQDGSYHSERFRRDELVWECKGTFKIKGKFLERTTEKCRYPQLNESESWSEWFRDEHTELLKIRHITDSSFELFIFGVHDHYWQKFIRLLE